MDAESRLSGGDDRDLSGAEINTKAGKCEHTFSGPVFHGSCIILIKIIQDNP